MRFVSKRNPLRWAFVWVILKFKRGEYDEERRIYPHPRGGWQKKYISLQAEKAHKSLSQYVRDAAMDKDVTVIDGVDDLIRELRRQGNNLNQLVVMARQGHVELVNMEPFMEVYENTWQTLNSLLSRVG